jgi:hypothetical protein
MGAGSGFPVAGEGYYAELKTNDQHLRLFAELYPLGYVAVVYDMNRKQYISREDANDFDGARRLAEESATRYSRYLGLGDLPRVAWRLNQQARRRQR